MQCKRGTSKAKPFREAENKSFGKNISVKCRHKESRHNQTRRTSGQKALNESKTSK